MTARRHENPHPTMHEPASYRIRSQGFLGSEWSERLAGMHITHSDSENDETVTILMGWLEDQAALAGVLNSLYELRLPVLSVECLQAGSTAPTAAGSDNLN